MPNIPYGKKGIYIYLDKEIHSKLLNFIKKKYKSSIYGALSYEIEEAIKYYLETAEMHTKTRKLENPSLPRSHKVALQIVDLLRERGYHKEVSVEEVYKAIEEVRGSDPRTKKKWLKFMIDHGYLGWKTHRILEISPALSEAEKFFSNLKPKEDFYEYRTSGGLN